MALTRNRTLDRKVKEALLALRIDRRFPKRQILEAYLNRIYLGDGHYGVEAAARGYFGKTAADLTAPEAALLAGLIKCPSACSPRIAPAAAKARRDTVLAEMREVGNLTQEEYAQAVDAPVALIPERYDPYDRTHLAMAAGGESDGGQPCSLYFVEAVRREVFSQFGAVDVLRGGLRIYTTIDMNLQRQAEAAIADRLQQIDPVKKNGTLSSLVGRLEGALVALDPRTGEVLALVGGRDFHESQFNRATQAQRQPGSAFKPLLFAAAIEQGYAPSSLVTDLDTPINTAQGPWLPSGEHENGSYTLRQALTVSSNRAAVRLMQLVGISMTQNYARRLGISSPLPSVPSLAIGTAARSLWRPRAPGLLGRCGPAKLAHHPRPRNAARRRVSHPRKHLRRPPSQEPRPRDQQAGGCGKSWNGVSRADRRLQAAGRRQDGHDRRLRRCVVYRLHAAPRDRRVVWLRRSQENHGSRICRNRGCPRMGALHDESDGRRSARLVPAS